MDEEVELHMEDKEAKDRAESQDMSNLSVGFPAFDAPMEAPTVGNLIITCINCKNEFQVENITNKAVRDCPHCGTKIIITAK